MKKHNNIFVYQCNRTPYSDHILPGPHPSIPVVRNSFASSVALSHSFSLSLPALSLCRSFSLSLHSLPSVYRFRHDFVRFLCLALAHFLCLIVSPFLSFFVSLLSLSFTLQPFPCSSLSPEGQGLTVVCTKAHCLLRYIISLRKKRIRTWNWNYGLSRLVR